MRQENAYLPVSTIYHFQVSLSSFLDRYFTLIDSFFPVFQTILRQSISMAAANALYLHILYQI